VGAIFSDRRDAACVKSGSTVTLDLISLPFFFWRKRRTRRAPVAIAGLAANGKAMEPEAVPIQYVAAVFGVTDPEFAIRWLVSLSCDPLTVALTSARR
jgi:hypothetical protein